MKNLNNIFVNQPQVVVNQIQDPELTLANYVFKLR